ncbi:MAG: hypothetical protein C0601_09945 [Candidatus Muiribacterium halophilum]|uniref:Glycosyltransferase RgtA/B/C/D-like domain-containing protein n=1 Tax=Muiribacterium halophilum TaxID=2053465 RepID=A0A2N5ZD49_MUIH1|nr:MAG: hypothetical protein C0601_09945 [Candidatus Muirbacterium halophilum]
MQADLYKLNNKTIIFLFITAILFGFFLVYSDINKGMFTDSYVNLRMSRDIGVFFNNDSSGIYNENVLYPILIKAFSLFFSHQKAALFINMIFLSIGGLFFYLTVKRLNGSNLSALFSLILFLTNPLILFWNLRVMPDICFMSLICVFLYFIIEKKMVPSICIFLLMCLLRSEVILLLPLFLYEKRLRDKRVIIISLCLIVLFGVFFSKSLIFNSKLAFESISKVDIKTNLKNHILNIPYNLDISVAMLFFFSLFYMIRLDKQKKRFIVVGYTFLVYFFMNVFWPFVQFRHWLPFIPAIYMLISEFFYFLEKAIKKEDKLKKLWIIVIPLFLYTAYGSFDVSINRIRESSDAMMDADLAGQYSKNTKAVIFTNIPEILYWYSPDKEIHDFQDYEWLLANIEKIGEVEFILSDKKFKKKIDWPDILKIEKRFESTYKFVYPCFPAQGAENSWKFLDKKNKLITVGTDIYKLDKLKFLMMFATDAFALKDYDLSAFYLKKALIFVKNSDVNILNDINSKLKITLYNSIKKSEDKEKINRLIKEALSIPVLPELDDKIKGMRNE